MAASSSPSTLNPLAEPFQSMRPAPNGPPTTDPAHERIFHSLSAYPFHQDAEFQSGLSAILGHADTPASPEEAEQNADLVLKAQCFYFARQNNLPTPIDPTSYKSWQRSRNPSADTTSTSPAEPRSTDEPNSSQEHHAEHSTSPPSFITSQAQAHPPHPAPPSSTTTDPILLPTDPPPPQPRYPTTFNHIVDLITRNQPIPGIETIPNIVLGTDHTAPNTVPPRRKPWEPPQEPPPTQQDDSAQVQPDTTATKPNPPSNGSLSGGGAAKPLYGGLLGPLKRTEESGHIKPIPVQTTTPGWQELAEEGAAGQVANDGDAPAAQAASQAELS